MKILSRLNKRRRQLLWKTIRNTRIDGALFSYLRNLYANYRLRRDHTVLLPHPTNMMLELGNVCNLHCHICPREYTYGKQMDVGFMPLERAKAIVDEAYPYLTSIGLTGLGETLLYPRMLEIVRYIKQKRKNIIITISTNAHFNGYLEKVEPLLPYIDNIQFSVDGMGSMYETMRPGTHFDTIKQNIQRTVEMGRNYGCQFLINCVVTDTNYKDMRRVLHLAHELHIENLNFNTMSIACQPDRDRSFYDFFRSSEYLAEVEALQREASDYPDIEVTGPGFPANSSFHDCIYPWEYPYITWDGYYVPCCGKPFPKLLHFGNVFEQGGLMQTLNSEKAQAFRKAWQKNQAPQFCHNCQLVDF